MKTCFIRIIKLQLIILSQILFSVLGFNYAVAGAQCVNQLRGINLAGAEFGERLPGVSGRDFKFPNESHIRYYTQAGFNAIRLPISWERIQPVLHGELDSAYSKELLKFMDQSANFGQLVVVDIHNYARYRGQIIGSPSVSPEAFRNLWSRLAKLLNKHPALYAYGLMNEPHHTQDLWHSIAQFGVDGVRAVDKTHIIYVAGDSWSGASSWPKVNPKPFVNDPNSKVVYEAHVYFDDDFSGRYQKFSSNTNYAERVRTRLQPFIIWLQENQQKGVIGEWGVPSNDAMFNDAIVEFEKVASSVCLDWFVWAGGQWSPNYNLSLEPIDGKDKVLLDILKK